ncbi:hypothetical protein SeLEV6574_g06760 [Synchytrium endobioticum]|uniref:Protein kinase domain-containing protein n=1 Tax=Synchytrium endobioticum TaxID=286115 RepID=A0A507CK85_9FUNG|nr:hypothetical protein SeLEV6574_g06760 [Synchytrium endobioticum]
MRRCGRFPNNVARFYAAEVVCAFEYMHSKDIIYRDLKPENLLIDSKRHIKFTDFGFAKHVPDVTWTLCGTPDYLAPEVIQSKGYSCAVDWWALGVLIFEMLAGYPPFSDEDHFKLYEKILACRPRFPTHFDPGAKDLTRKLLTADLTKRFGNLRDGSADIKCRNWFLGMEWTKLVKKEVPAPYIPPSKHQEDTSNFEVYPEDHEAYGLPGPDPHQSSSVSNFISRPFFNKCIIIDMQTIAFSLLGMNRLSRVQKHYTNTDRSGRTSIMDTDTASSKWSRLIRFIAANDDKIHYGEAVNADSRTGFLPKCGIEARVIIGNPLGRQYRVTDQVVQVEKLLTPLQRVPIFVCIGLNYRKHAEETKMPIPEHPIVFTKPSSAAIGPGEAVVIPKTAQDKSADYECELGIVIGETCKNVSERDAYRYIAGYTVANDISARKWQRCGSQWTYGKSFDTFGAFGPQIVSTDIIKDPQRLALKMSLNGKMMQDSNTNDMIFNVAQVIAHCSAGTTLEAGTVIMTGTPHGVGAARGVYIKEGDVLDCEIESIGHLINPLAHRYDITKDGSATQIDHMDQHTACSTRCCPTCPAIGDHAQDEEPRHVQVAHDASGTKVHHESHLRLAHATSTYAVHHNPQVRQTHTKSSKLSSLHSVFSDDQRLAYVGLTLMIIKTKRLLLSPRPQSARPTADPRLPPTLIRAAASYDEWSHRFITRLFLYLEMAPEEEQLMRTIYNRDEDDVLPADLAAPLLASSTDAVHKLEKTAMQMLPVQLEPLENGIAPTLDSLDPTATAMSDNSHLDIRFTILSHLFVLSVCDGMYDARSRHLLRTVAKYLYVHHVVVSKLEFAISQELRLSQGMCDVVKDDKILGERNNSNQATRWLLMGAATVAGGTLIGLTAGLAAPLIGAGLGLALSGVGVAGGTAVGGFLGSSAGIALIATSGVLTGGGMAGMKMLKRTKGVSEFEFQNFEDSVAMYEAERQKRREKRLKKMGIQSPPSLGSIEIDAHLSSALSNFDVLQDTYSEAEVDDNWEATTMASSSPNLTSDAENKNGTGATPQITFSNAKEDARPKQTNVLITVSGWIARGRDDHSLPFLSIEQGVHGDQYALIWESKDLLALHSALSLFYAETASFILQQTLQATLLPVLLGALSGPLWLLKLNYLMDNPWGIAMSKASKAGKVLADTLILQVQEHRPVTLVGFSLGARLIFDCLTELAERGAYGLVEEAFIFGAPLMATKKEWETAATAVSGRIVNGYLQKDWVLGVLYRTSAAAWSDVAGLGPAPDEIHNVESVSLDDVISSHLEYRVKLPEILLHVGFQVNRNKFEEEDEAEQLERHYEENKRAREKEEALKAKAEAEKKKEEERAAQATSGKKSWFGGGCSNPSGKMAPGVLHTSSSCIANGNSNLSNSSYDANSSVVTPDALSSKSSNGSWWFRSSTSSNIASKSPTPANGSIPSSRLEDMMNSDNDEELEIREIKSTLPPLVVDLDSLAEADGNGRSGYSSGRERKVTPPYVLDVETND